MTFPGRSKLLYVLLPFALGGMSSHSAAQASLTAAEGGTAIIPKQQGFLSIDLTESKIGVRRYAETVLKTGSLIRVCDVDFPVIDDHTEGAVELALAAEEGKRTLLSKGAFSPGVEGSISFAYFNEHGFVIPTTCPPKAGGDVEIDPQTRGYHAFFVKLRGEWVTRNTFEAGSGPSPQITTEDGSGATVGLSAGFNLAWTERRVLGASLEVAHEWASPADADPQSVCTSSVTGTNAEGTPVSVQTCEDRYLGPLDEYNVATGRIDYVTKLGVPKVGRPSLGVIAAASVTARSGLHPTYSLALGPTFHPAGSPSRIQGGALFELQDITNANGKHPNLRDQFIVRVYVGLPF